MYLCVKRLVTKVTVVVALEDKRTKLRVRVVRALQEVIIPLIQCKFAKSHEPLMSKYLRELYRAGIYPTTLTDSVATTLEQIRSIDTFSFSGCGYGNCVNGDGVTEQIRKIAAEGMSWVEGLCLDCVRLGSRNAGRCRIDHG